MKLSKRLYADFSKVEPQEDGTLKVFGVASSGAVDSDGETVTPDAMKNALPDYMKFGAVREMHQPSAAGTALKAEVDADGVTQFSAHIVDPTACLKVTTGVYKGFSIGGKVTERDTANKTIIKGLKLVEISLVDRPANPEALMTMWKAEVTPEDDVAELAELLDAGTVTPAKLLALAKAAALGEASAVAAAPTADVNAEPVDTSANSGSEKSAGSDDLKKGMGDVAEFARLLQSLGYLQMGATWEAEYEGDNSPLPAALSAWLKTGLDIFNAMAAEECEELCATLSAAANTPEVMAMAAQVELAKAGAKFSKDTQTKLGAAHDAMKAACDHMDKLGYKTDDEEAAAGVTDTKAAAASVDDTLGIAEDTGAAALVKAAVSQAIAPLNEALEKARKETADLQAKVEEMGKRAAPGRALLKAVSITKAADTAPAAETPEAEMAPEGSFQRAEQEMRKVFAGRGRALT